MGVVFEGWFKEVHKMCAVWFELKCLGYEILFKFSLVEVHEV